jgi:hypothetical protein
MMYLSESGSLSNLKARMDAGHVTVLFDTDSKPYPGWEKEKIHEVDNYPMGRRADTKGVMRWGVEATKRGVRVVRTSKNRWGTWNNPKKETYARRLIFLHDNEEDRLYFLSQGTYGGWALYGGNLYMMPNGSYYGSEEQLFFETPPPQEAPDLPEDDDNGQLGMF